MGVDDKGMSQLLVLCKLMKSSKEKRQSREGEKKRDREFLCVETYSVGRNKTQ